MAQENDRMKQRLGESGSHWLPPDNLNAQIGVLTRREVEARILSPIIEALSQEFDRASVVRVVRDTIIRIAEKQGAG